MSSQPTDPRDIAGTDDLPLFREGRQSESEALAHRKPRQCGTRRLALQFEPGGGSLGSIVEMLARLERQHGFRVPFCECCWPESMGFAPTWFEMASALRKGATDPETELVADEILGFAVKVLARERWKAQQGGGHDSDGT